MKSIVRKHLRNKKHGKGIVRTHRRRIKGQRGIFTMRDKKNIMGRYLNARNGLGPNLYGENEEYLADREFYAAERRLDELKKEDPFFVKIALKGAGKEGENIDNAIHKGILKSAKIKHMEI